MKHPILKEKLFPSQYPSDAVKVLETMAFNPKNIEIMGSQSLRSQLYAGDYDAFEVVESSKPIPQALTQFVSGFQQIIKNLQKIPNLHIGDIKAGVIEDWRVVPKNKPYVFRSAKEKVEALFSSKLITSKEAETALSILKPTPTKMDVLKARQEIKFHIVRWKPKDILNGYVILRDGRKYTLEEALHSPTITKLDVIALIQGKYTELSIIYEFHAGKSVLNPDIINPTKSLKDDILFYKTEGKSFKVIKRKFALAKLTNNLKDIEKYHSILNSDLGKLYVVYSDVKTLADLLEDTSIPSAQLKEAISGFKHRLARIYTLEDYLKSEKAILSDLSKASASKNPLPILRHIETQLNSYLNSNTKLYGGRIDYLSYHIPKI